MASRNNTSSLVKLGYITIFTVVVWIAYSVYLAFQKPVDTTVPPEALQVFDASLDPQALTELQESIYLTGEEMFGNVSETQSIITEEPVEEEANETVETEITEEVVEEETPANEEL